MCCARVLRGICVQAVGIGVFLQCLSLGRCGAGNVDLLHRAVDGLSRGVDYFYDVLREINLDGGFGLKVVDEFLKMFVVAEPGVFKILGEDMRQKLIEIKNKARHTLDQALPYIQKDRPKYFYDLGAWLYPSYILQWFTVKTTDPSLREIPVSCALDMWNETKSDSCLQEILGTRSDDSRTCDISEFCLGLQIRPKMRDYMLTHQVLYFQVLEAYDCVKNVKNLHERNLLNMRDYLCANVMRGAEEIAEADFPDSHRDLFMEQVGLCGLWGYSDFYRPEWLEKILEWQMPEGCFNRIEGWRCTDNLEPDSHGIVKRDEKKLSDDCYSHRTSVALAALTVSIRFCAETIAAEYLPHLKPWQHFDQKL